MRTLTLFAISVLLGSSASAAEPGPVLVELFTSQGCSSCPPADRLLAELAERADVVALSFHVPYWDRLGWPDGFATPAWSDRQRAYADILGTSGLYTPQMVVAGRLDVVGSDQRRVLAAVDLARTRAPAAAIGFAGGEASLPKLTLDHPARLLLAFYTAQGDVAIGGGEPKCQCQRGDLQHVRASMFPHQQIARERAWTIAAPGGPDLEPWPGMAAPDMQVRAAPDPARVCRAGKGYRSMGPVPNDILAVLRRAGLADFADDPGGAPLTGGVSSDIWRVDLPAGAVCVKRALAQLKVKADWRAPRERSGYEAAWLEIARGIVPTAAPTLLFMDAAAGALVMSYFPPSRSTCFHSR